MTVSLCAANCSDSLVAFHGLRCHGLAFARPLRSVNGYRFFARVRIIGFGAQALIIRN